MQVKKTKVAGIIAEFNPFHNGHKRLIDYAKQNLHADHVIIAMSGNFVQRGEPAITDKFTRAQMALSCGADLVFEIPAVFACAAAGDFARAGVALIDKTGIADTLLFGIEGSCPLSFLREASAILSAESGDFSDILNRGLKAGMSYPKAREAALHACLDPGGNATPMIRALSSPNNILALEYLSALSERSAKLLPEALIRLGDGYHAQQPSDAAYTSATALRGILQEINTADSHSADRDAERLLSPLSAYVPAELLPQYAELLKKGLQFYPMHTDVLGAALSSILLRHADDDFTRYADVSEEIGNRLRRGAALLMGFDARIEQLWTKQYTRSRISRALLHIYLGITKDTVAAFKTQDYVPYLRLLGFSAHGQEILPLLKKHAQVPVLTKPAAAKELLAEDIRISNLYYSLLLANGSPVPNEYERGILHAKCM